MGCIISHALLSSAQVPLGPMKDSTVLSWNNEQQPCSCKVIHALDRKTTNVPRVMRPIVTISARRLHTRSLATTHVFTYKGRPLERESRSFEREEGK